MNASADGVNQEKAGQVKAGLSPRDSAAMADLCRYPFFQAVKVIEMLHPHKTPVGRAASPKDEAVRFKARTGFAFPAGDVSAVEGEVGQPVRVEVACFGLIGPAGALPHWYHELALERKLAGDGAMTAFYDMLQHRLISLFYLACKRSRVAAARKSDNSDDFSRYLLSLIGLGTPSAAGETDLKERVPLMLGGQLARRVPSAATFETVVQEAFGIDVELEQFVPQALELAREDRSRLGQANSQLGESCLCGSQAWDIQGKFRVRLGPLTFREFSEFLPGAKKLGQLATLIRYLVGVEYEFEIRLVLRKEEVPECRVGAGGPGAPQLGWATWLKAAEDAMQADPFVTIQEKEIDLNRCRRCLQT